MSSFGFGISKVIFDEINLAGEIDTLLDRGKTKKQIVAKLKCPAQAVEDRIVARAEMIKIEADWEKRYADFQSED